MNKKICILLVLLMLISLVGCNQDTKVKENDTSKDISSNVIDKENSESGKKLKIVATLFPQYDFARQIAGDKADVILLLPPGTDSHSFEPTASNIIDINKSDLFIYTGKYMEIWAERIIESLESDDVTILDVSKGITLVKNEEEENDLVGHYHEYDPHIWTSPVMAKTMAENIGTTLCYLDPENADYYKARTEKYLNELESLNLEIKTIVEDGKRNKIYFGERFALYYFAKEYGLDYMSAYDNCSSETEPSVHDMALIIDEVKENNIPVIYYQELSDPKVSRAISEATGAKMLLFHSCHNLTKEDFDNGVTYVDLMKQNAINLKEGLN